MYLDPYEIKLYINKKKFKRVIVVVNQFSLY